MSATERGELGPKIVAELRALAAQRVQLAAQYEQAQRAYAAKEATLLAVAAEAQGCTSDGPFTYDLAAETWSLATESGSAAHERRVGP